VKAAAPRVRVVDRDAELAAALVAVLRGEGIDACGSPRHGEPDALVVGLPAPDEVSPRTAPGVAVVLLDGGARFGEPEAWLLGRPGYVLLTKPVTPDELVEAVRTALAESGRAHLCERAPEPLERRGGQGR